MEQVIDRLDESGKGAWLVAMILGFIVFWPIGLAILFFLLWSGRMSNWKECRGVWYEADDEARRERRSRRRRNRHRHGFGHGYRHGHRQKTSGNTAFDAYREETLRRLEEEQHEFEDFLDRLRQARDKEEFDQFMDERRRNPAPKPDANDAAGPEGEAPSPA